MINQWDVPFQTTICDGTNSSHVTVVPQTSMMRTTTETAKTVIVFKTATALISLDNKQDHWLAYEKKP